MPTVEREQWLRFERAGNVEHGKLSESAVADAARVIGQFLRDRHLSRSGRVVKASPARNRS